MAIKNSQYISLPFPTEDNGSVVGMLAIVIQNALSDAINVPVYSEVGDFKYPMISVRLKELSVGAFGQHTQSRMGITYEINYIDEIKGKGSTGMSGLETSFYNIGNKLAKEAYNLAVKQRWLYRGITVGAEFPIRFSCTYMPMPNEKTATITGNITLTSTMDVMTMDVAIDDYSVGGSPSYVRLKLPSGIYLEDADGNIQWEYGSGIVVTLPAFNEIIIEGVV